MGFLDAKYEPLRRYVYTVLIALVALAVAFSLVTAEAAVAICAVIAAACIVPVTELARSKVTPVAAETSYADGRHAA